MSGAGQNATTGRDLGLLLKNMRVGRGLSLKQAGVLVGRRHQVLAQVEAGKIVPAVDAWLAIFTAYGGKLSVKGNPPTLRLEPGGNGRG
ncbi:hypothetical protein DRQ53_12015 [bacterium]|nr:MAG: hypothetical protein DRQ53_12015 [bacterium]